MVWSATAPQTRAMMLVLLMVVGFAVSQLPTNVANRHVAKATTIEEPALASGDEFSRLSVEASPPQPSPAPPLQAVPLHEAAADAMMTSSDATNASNAPTSTTVPPVSYDIATGTGPSKGKMTEPEPEQLEAQSARRARFLRSFKGRSIRILMIGDSHVRYYFAALIRAMGYTYKEGVLKVALAEKGVAIHITVANTPLFDFKAGTREVIGDFRKTHGTVDAVFLGRGAWDVAMNDTLPHDILLQTHHIAGQIRRAFPEAALFGMVPHYFHSPTFPTLRPCVAEPRILRLREAFAEGMMLAHLDHLAQQDDHFTAFTKKRKQREWNPVPKLDRPSKMFLVDTFCFTKQLGAYTDHWGHHYSDNVLLPVLADFFAHPAIARGAAAARDAIFSGGPRKASTIFELPNPPSAHDASWWRSGTPKPLDIFAGKTAAETQEWVSHLKFGDAARPPPLEETSTGQRTFKIFSHHNGSDFSACKESAEATWRARWNSVVGSFEADVLADREVSSGAGVGNTSRTGQSSEKEVPYLERRARVEERVVVRATKNSQNPNHASVCGCIRFPFYEMCAMYKPLRGVKSWRKGSEGVRTVMARHYCKLSQKLMKWNATSNAAEAAGADNPKMLTLLDTSSINTDARYWDHFLAMICTAPSSRIGECMMNFGGNALRDAWALWGEPLPEQQPKRLQFLSGNANGLNFSSAGGAMNSMLRGLNKHEPPSWCNFSAMNHALGLHNEGGGSSEALQQARAQFFQQLLKPAGTGCPSPSNGCYGQVVGKVRKR